MERTLSNQLNYDFALLFQEYINNLFENISVKQSHVLLADPNILELLVSVNKVKYSDITHISRQTYFEQFYAYVFGNDINPLVAKAFHQM